VLMLSGLADKVGLALFLFLLVIIFFQGIIVLGDIVGNWIWNKIM
jgi:hypothetical protein